MVHTLPSGMRGGMYLVGIHKTNVTIWMMKPNSILYTIKSDAHISRAKHKSQLHTAMMVVVVAACVCVCVGGWGS